MLVLSRKIIWAGLRGVIEEVKKNSYNHDHGNQTKVKGLEKEVNNGDL